LNVTNEKNKTKKLRISDQIQNDDQKHTWSRSWSYLFLSSNTHTGNGNPIAVIFNGVIQS